MDIRILYLNIFSPKGCCSIDRAIEERLTQLTRVAFVAERVDSGTYINLTTVRRAP